MTRAQRIARRFGGAARDYDAHSAPQRHAAEMLAQKIFAARLPAAPRILEIGCGTGHLTELLMRRVTSADFFVSDIAPEMIAACRQRLPQAHYLVMDGEHPALAGGFDLICSNLAAQWFGDLPTALRQLAGLLAPGGQLALSLLGEHSFQEWHAAHRALGLTAGTLRFDPATAIAAMLPTAEFDVDLAAEHYLDHPASALEFVHQLRAIGADTPQPGHRPLSAGQLRRVLHQLGNSPRITYQILYVAFRLR